MKWGYVVAIAAILALALSNDTVRNTIFGGPLGSKAGTEASAPAATDAAQPAASSGSSRVDEASGISSMHGAVSTGR